MSRIILKISGEALKSEKDLVSDTKLSMIWDLVKLLKKDKHKISIVIGGGNIFRGREHLEMSPLNRDTIGMLGTVINGLYIKDFLAKKDIACVISTPFVFPNLINTYEPDELKKLYDEDQVVIFAGGVGKSGYSTDSGVIRAAEIVKGDLIIKLTNVDGVYNDDPHVNKQAKKFSQLTYDEILQNEYKFMDLYAIKKCQEYNIKILVMSLNDYAQIGEFFAGKNIGTLIS